MPPKITETDLIEAIDMLSLLKFFPNDSRAAVMELLRNMCPHREALRWLVQKASLLSEWPGPGELRGLLCMKYTPADGIDRHCNLPGYTAAEMEAKHYERHQQLKQSGGYIEGEAKEMLRQLSSGVKQIRSAK